MFTYLVHCVVHSFLDLESSHGCISPYHLPRGKPPSASEGFCCYLKLFANFKNVHFRSIRLDVVGDIDENKKFWTFAKRSLIKNSSNLKLGLKFVSESWISPLNS